VRKALLGAALVLLAALFFCAVVWAESAAPAQPAAGVKSEPAKPAVQKAPDPKPAAPVVPAGPPPRPASRTIIRKAGDYLFTLKIKPGVPEPGDMVEYVLDVVQVAQVPHPVYGDRIPIGGMGLVAKVSFEKAPDVLFRYRVQPVGDEGTYGFHYTPEQIGKYNVVFAAQLPEGKPMEVRYSFPVGQWPLPPDTDLGDAIDEGGGGKTSRYAKPKVGPVMPVGPVGPGQAGVVEKTDALRGLMRKLERVWLYLGKDVLADRKPDLGAIARESEGVGAIAKKANGMVPQSLALDGAEFDTVLSGLAAAATALSAAAKEGNDAKVGRLYKETTYNFCTRCHLKFRFQSAMDLSKYPVVQEGK
jgi:hypothetical protein